MNLLLYREIGQTTDPISYRVIQPHSSAVPSDSAPHFQTEIGSPDLTSSPQTEVGSSDSMPSLQTKVGYFDSKRHPQTTVCSTTPSDPASPATPFPTKVASQTTSRPSASAPIVPAPLGLPDFGPAFRQHMSAKHNPEVYRASLAAWRLLAEGLALLGLPLPEVRFAPNGKPYFSDFSLQILDFGLPNPNLGLNLTDSGLNRDVCGISSSNPHLFFSLSHSESYAAALLSTAPCGVDVECIRTEVSERLRDRCMHPAELAEGMDFFTAWTRKECIAKLDGSGLPTHPNQLDASDARYRNWFAKRITDRSGREYVLSALSMNNDAFRLVVFA